MRERYIAPAIMLIAGAITSILNIINGLEPLAGLKRLLIVLLVFYIIGKIATMIIKKVTNKEDEPEEEQENENDQENTQLEENVITTEESVEDTNQ